jgi:hypothetical protein
MIVAGEQMALLLMALVFACGGGIILEIHPARGPCCRRSRRSPRQVMIS